MKKTGNRLPDSGGTGNVRVIKNVSWIIGCQIVKAVLGVVISMLTARYLGPSNFGLIHYAASVVSFAVPVMQLGLTNIIVKELADRPEREGEILGTCIVSNLVSSVFCILGIFLFTSVANSGDKDAITVCFLYSIMLAAQALEVVKYWFQAKLLSKYTSVISLVAYFIISGYKFYLLMSGKSIYWFALSNVFDYLIIALSLLAVYRRLGGQKLSFSFPALKDMFAKSKYYIVSAMMITIFAQTDKTMITLMLGETEAGYYSAAIECASMTGFIIAAIIESLRPVIFEDKQLGEDSFCYRVSQLYSIITYFALAQCVVMTVFAKPIIHILYGDQYINSITVLQISVWFTTFSYYGAVRNIWMLAESKQKYLWIINLCGAVTNVTLNAVLIPMIGINGAAIASVITQFSTNVLLGFIIRPIRQNNVLMLKGLNPRYVLNAVKSVIGK